MSLLAYSRLRDENFPSLMWTLMRTDFKTRYQGTLGGFVWALLKPFLMFAVLMSVYSFLFASEPQFRVNLLIGLFLYEFFGESTRAGLAALHSKGYLLCKARVPAWTLVVSSISNAVITLTIFATVITLFIGITGGGFRPAAVPLFAGYLALYVVMAVGFSLGASVLYLKFRDLNQVWDVLIQAGFFLAPIIYPLRIIPERYHYYFYLWPPTPVIQFSRSVLVDGAVPSVTAHVYLVVEAVVVLAVGTMIFRRYSARAAELL
jgi:lipopolysaccharide transport system permease protein